MKHVCVAARIGEGKAPGEGNSHSYCRDEQRSVAWRAEQVPSVVCLDATLQRDEKRTESTRSTHTSAVASPSMGRVGGRKRDPLGSDPADAHGIGDMRPRSATRSHPHRWGPCSALRRSLLRAAVRRRFWLQPFGLARVFACSSRISAKGFCLWGGDGSRAAHRDHGSHVTVPANGPAANESRRRVVESPLLRMTKPQDFRLALSENRDSASRVSLC